MSDYLMLEDHSDVTSVSEIFDHLEGSWCVSKDELSGLRLLVAYESVGSWGCDSSGWYLFRRETDGQLLEVHGSHCSCYGFEGQFSPEETSLEYIMSDKFYFPYGGYDESGGTHKDRVKEFLSGLDLEGAPDTLREPVTH